MNRSNIVLLCLAYIIGLLSTALLGFPLEAVSWSQTGIVGGVFVVLGIITGLAIPKFWRTAPRFQFWILAGIIAALAVFHFQWRSPSPSNSDVSRFVSGENATSQMVEVIGTVDKMPRLTQSQRSQFWLNSEQLNNETVTGKLYVTVPLLQATGIYPGDSVRIKGLLYQPKESSNPGGFNFKAYLASQGSFAGLSGREVSKIEDVEGKSWGWWRLRQRIIRAQLSWLGSPKGQLVSSMVLGRRAVDLPYNIRDDFIETGLAHVLAASGFHVSLILGVALALTRPLSSQVQFGVGLATLLIYVGLTGVQPSVARAAIMGFGALFGLVTERKVIPLGSLLLAAILLLIINPLWIWDLGFQLSFLATLGLVTTMPAVVQRLDWLPPAIATIIAIPIAIFPWVLPIQLYVFGVIAPYSIVVNIITVPLIIIISLGGMISALAALIYPLSGSAIAWLLNYPVSGLLTIVSFFASLPGNSVALGTISLVQLMILYGLIGLIWLTQWGKQRWGLVSLFGLMLILIPVWHTNSTLQQVTVLASNQESVVVIQDQGNITLVNAGDGDTANFAILPFLQQQGINRIDTAIALNSPEKWDNGWTQILAELPISQFLSHSSTSIPNANILSAEETVSLNQGEMTLVSDNPAILALELFNSRWLFLGDNGENTETAIALPPKSSETIPQILLWSGKPLKPELLERLQPTVAIASSNTIDSNTLQQLKQSQTQIYLTGQDGAIQWNPKSGFNTILDSLDSKRSLL
ncbi:MAG: ComEC/Rec2 family competence protein [Chroococcales cyanobacterium]